jgi:hypothetical protein
MIKIASIFAVLNFLTLCEAVATTPAESTPYVSLNSNDFSSKLSTRGYSLTKAELWKPNPANGSDVYGFKFTFSPDCCSTGPDITQMYGSSSGSGV